VSYIIATKNDFFPSQFCQNLTALNLTKIVGLVLYTYLLEAARLRVCLSNGQGLVVGVFSCKVFIFLVTGLELFMTSNHA